MTFADSRLQLHWAAQCVAGVARALLPPREDDSHSSLSWSRELRALVTDEVPAGWRGGIRFHDLTLLAGSDDFPLLGRTLQDGLSFFSARAGCAVSTRADALPPAHAVASEAPFDADRADLETISRDYANANDVLQRFRDAHSNASDIRCWPHHFDIATLLTLRGGRTIGAGFLAGDDHYPQPYWYVTPYPYPENRANPPLTRGFWNTEGWHGAVLLGSEGAAEFLDEASALFV